jgi:hypothetical protein
MPSLTEKNHLIKGLSQTISLHNVETQYQILSINNLDNFNNVGFFNKKTDFRIGEENSILTLNNNLEQETLKTSEIGKYGTSYIIYPIPCFYLKNQNYLKYNSFENHRKIDINLTFEFGTAISVMLQHMAETVKNDKIVTLKKIKQFFIDYIKTVPVLNQYPAEFYNLLISYNVYGYSINKNIINNSNPLFLLGILNGFTTKEFTNINIYIFTSILNYLGAMYSIVRGDNNSRVIHYRLPKIFQNIALSENLELNPNIKFKNDDMFIQQIIEKIDQDKKDLVFKTDLWQKVFRGEVILIDTKYIQFQKIDKSNNKEIMYDFTMSRADATNYTIPFGPVLKNSDGDILGVMALFGKESLQEAKVFSPTTKDYYRSFNDGEIQSWITKDAVLGLYNITK